MALPSTAYGQPNGNTPADIRKIRQPGKGRPTLLNNPDYARKVAEAFVSGITRAEMADLFEVDPHTITRWRRDPRVKAHVGKLIEDRVLQITRKTDAEIERRLREIDKLTIKEILAIRAEFLPGIVRDQMAAGDEQTTAQAMEALENNPELADKMLALLEGRTEAVPAGEPD